MDDQQKRRIDAYLAMAERNGEVDPEHKPLIVRLIESGNWEAKIASLRAGALSGAERERWIILEQEIRAVGSYLKHSQDDPA